MRLSTALLAGLLGAAAVVHTVKPKIYDAAIPEILPGEPRTWVYLSGAAEGALAAGLLVPATRRLSALGAFALFIAVFPSNVKLYRDARSPKAKRILGWRLPLQLPLLWWAAEEYRRG